MKKIMLGALMLVGLAACNGGKDAGCCAGETSSVAAVDEVIRLNVLYTANDNADHKKIMEIASKLVEASRNDAGCISYDIYKSGTVPGEYIIIETWENDSVLDIHSNAPHFTEYVPQLRSLGTMRAERCQIEK